MANKRQGMLASVWAGLTNPAAAFETRLDQGVSEARNLAWMMLGGLGLFIVNTIQAMLNRMPAHQADAFVGAQLVIAMLFLPLFLLLLSVLVRFVMRLLGAERPDFHGSRVALGWATMISFLPMLIGRLLLAVAPWLMGIAATAASLVGMVMLAWSFWIFAAAVAAGNRAALWQGGAALCFAFAIPVGLLWLVTKL